MVVDDSITMRKVTSRLVERHGMRATVAKDGLDASGLLEDEVPDAVILDIEMPRMDGFELAAHIRNQEHLWHLPIVMVTSRSGDKHRQRAMDLGVNAYLGKPYREEELLSAIRQVLGPRGERIAI
jgi:chemosensory pili system protein ChpA (sensor histidine kinase/response regulator)